MRIAETKCVNVNLEKRQTIKLNANCRSDAMDKWDLQTIKEIIVRKKSKKLWILKNLNVYKIYRITYSNLNSHPVTKKLKKKSKKSEESKRL